MKKAFVTGMLISLLSLPLFAQEETTTDPPNETTAPDYTSNLESTFGMDMALGVQNIAGITWQSLSMVPDISLGKVGIGLDVTLNYDISSNDSGDMQFNVRKEDWVVEDGDFQDWMQLYLSKVIYIRYGLKGDPLYAKFGAINDGTLGNGFILGNYSNMLFRPEIKPLGLSFDLDSKLFGIPYVGIETFVGNLAAFDVVGSRLYVRPIAFLETPILKELQLGYTIATDRAPFHYAEDLALEDDLNTTILDESAIDESRPHITDYVNETVTYFDEKPVTMMGIDFKQPLVNNNLLQLALFGDVVFQQKTSGSMVGLGGRLAKVFTYGAQLRFLGENFIPTYFDQTYDIDRTGSKYLIASGTLTGTFIDPYNGWFASLGTSLIEDKLVFNLSLDGPFAKVVDETANPDLAFINYPHLRGIFAVQPGLLPKFNFNVSYDKRDIRGLGDLTSLEDSVIGAVVEYQTGPAVISFVYDLKYNNDAAVDENKWDVTTKIETRINLF